MSKMTEGDIQALKLAESDAEWNSVCDQIKAKNGGGYPSDWWEHFSKCRAAFEVNKERAIRREVQASFSRRDKNV